MNTFLVVAAVMAALAAAAVAVPLLRDRRSRLVGVVSAVLVAGAAAGLYPLWSTGNWHEPVAGATPGAGPDVLAMVAKLEDHLKKAPDDLTGWLMLGRSYAALERMDDAILAYDHAQRLDGGNTDAILGLGEAMSLRAGGAITPPAAELFERALQLAPDNPKALLYAGFAAAARGDDAAARARWQALKALHPPEQIQKLLDERIAELGPGGPGGGAGGVSAAGEGPAVASSLATAAAAPAGAGAADAGEAQAVVNIRIAPELEARLSRDAPLFVFAREPGFQGPPLAAKRLTGAAVGTSVHLSAGDSMIPGRVLKNGQRVSITARIAFGGQPLPVKGDLYGEVTYDVGHDGVRNLVIDRVAE